MDENNTATMQNSTVKKKKRKVPIALKVILIILGVLLAAALSLLLVGYFTFHGKVTNIKPIDENGHLFYCEYTGNYENNLTEFFPKLVQEFGCSSYTAKNQDGDIITGRNYDFSYYDSEGNTNNQNFVMRINLPGKYESLNMVDAKMLSKINIRFDNEELQNGTCSNDLMALFAYVCMDGINEKGLTISTLNVDVRDDEPTPNQDDPDKNSYMATEIIRHALDYCADVDEVIEYVQSINYRTAFKMTQHLLVTDASGETVVLEWRGGELYVKRQDLLTNFYVNFDDAEDYYKKGVLKETYVEPVSKYNKYRYGFGHGYDRFAKLLTILDNNRTQANEYATLTNDQAMDALSEVSQIPVPEERTSNTLYSVVYNNTKKSLEICTSRDYEHKYSFSIDE